MIKKRPPDLEKGRIISLLKRVGMALHMDHHDQDYETIKKAIALIKSRDPVKPKILGKEMEYYYACGQCRRKLDKRFVYCPSCGREINWYLVLHDDA